MLHKATLLKCMANSNAWLKFWDNAQDHSVEGIHASLTLLKTLCATVFSVRQCPMDSRDHVIPEDYDHLLSHHVSSWTEVITLADLYCIRFRLLHLTQTVTLSLPQYGAKHNVCAVTEENGSINFVCHVMRDYCLELRHSAISSHIYKV